MRFTYVLAQAVADATKQEAGLKRAAARASGTK